MLVKEFKEKIKFDVKPSIIKVAVFSKEKPRVKMVSKAYYDCNEFLNDSTFDNIKIEEFILDNGFVDSNIIQNKGDRIVILSMV